MPSKIKKLYKKTKKSFKNIVSFKKHTKGQEAKPKLPYNVEQSLNMVSWQNKVKVSKVENIKKSNKWAKEKIKSLKIKPAEKNSKRGNIFKNGFTKLKEKLNPIKAKKNKIIGSKKLAFLLTSGTIIAILPMFNLAPLPALAITSACVFSINFIAVKTLKKFIKQRKLAGKSKTLDESGKLENASVEPANNKQAFRDGK
ncbi:MULTISPECIES: hypothetical protein [unclassified Wolbachia]|uniref:hypothetical protein n=1 Tax=unclassified Wolbachia TaxID=2640676 RepID=UPI0030CFE835